MSRMFQLTWVLAAETFVWAVCSVSTATAQNTPRLRYGFQDQQQHAYDVKIEAEEEDTIETRAGVLTYVVLSATDQQFVVKFTGALAPNSKMKPGKGGIRMGGPPHIPAFPRFGPSGPEGITFDRQGKIVVTRPLTALPYLLGAQETLLIEEFPADARPTWETNTNTAVTERTSSGMFPMRFGPGGGATTERAAQERIQYAITENRGDVIRIRKTYSLRTAEEADGVVRFDMTGNGELVFDTQAGILQSLSMKYQVKVNEKNLQQTIPVSVTCRLLTAAELAELQKKATAAAAAAAAANAPKPFAVGEREKLLTDLKSGDERRLQSAADRMVKVPVDDKPVEFAVLLGPLLSHSNDWIKGAAAKALVVWATPEAEAALIAASASENLWVRAAAIEALGKIPSEAGAEAVAAQMYRNRGEVTKALKAMGPIAEAAAIPCLKDRDLWARKETCQVLAEIGGAESVKALREYAQRVTGFDQADANKAMETIEHRLRTSPRPAVATKPKATPAAKVGAAASGLRKWRDATGTFEVEGQFVSSQDQTVTLKKKDGRTIVVPLEKLSDADRAFVEQQTKPANPFE